MDIFLSPKGHWIGPTIRGLPNDITNLILDEFNIIECSDDISILTQPEVNYILFFLTRKNKELFLLAQKICINLHKKIILLYEDSIYDIILEQHVIHGELKLSDKEFKDKIKTLALHISLQNTDLTSSGELSAYQQLNPSNGSRIDIFQTLKFIEDNLEKDLREEEVAELCHYSVTYFSKLFHSVIGISFRDYLINKRINKAKQLLAKLKNEKIASIAYQCGYNDVSYFSRIFKKKTGLTPGGYRKVTQCDHGHL